MIKIAFTNLKIKIKIKIEMLMHINLNGMSVFQGPIRIREGNKDDQKVAGNKRENNGSKWGKL